MVHNSTDKAYSIQIINLTKSFKKKRHRGVFGFLRKKPEKKESGKKGDLTVALDSTRFQEAKPKIESTSYWT